MKLTIKNIRARAVMVPLKRPPQSASGTIGDASLVLIDLETNEGITGSAYLFAFMKPMLKPTVQMIEGVGPNASRRRVCAIARNPGCRR